MGEGIYRTFIMMGGCLILGVGALIVLRDTIPGAADQRILILKQELDLCREDSKRVEADTRARLGMAHTRLQTIISNLNTNVPGDMRCEAVAEERLDQLEDQLRILRDELNVQSTYSIAGLRGTPTSTQSNP